MAEEQAGAQQAAGAEAAREYAALQRRAERVAAQAADAQQQLADRFACSCLRSILPRMCRCTLP